MPCVLWCGLRALGPDIQGPGPDGAQQGTLPMRSDPCGGRHPPAPLHDIPSPLHTISAPVPRVVSCRMTKRGDQGGGGKKLHVWKKISYPLPPPPSRGWSRKKNCRTKAVAFGICFLLDNKLYNFGSGCTKLVNVLGSPLCTLHVMICSSPKICQCSRLCPVVLLAFLSQDVCVVHRS